MRHLAWLVLLCATLPAAEFRAGAARIDITPDAPIWLSGYASRTHPSEGVLQQLYARAVAFEDPTGNRLLIVSTDLIGLPRVLSDEVAALVLKKYELDRERLLLNSSHTHTGPSCGRI